MIVYVVLSSGKNDFSDREWRNAFEGVFSKRDQAKEFISELLDDAENRLLDMDIPFPYADSDIDRSLAYFIATEDNMFWEQFWIEEHDVRK